MQSSGIHHVTAIASDPQRNLNFYAGLLGLRLVKKTVNFDDPGTYHFYYGDEIGRPGTILTFFPWPGARRGTLGNGQATVLSFSIPENAMGYWIERLRAHNVAVGEVISRMEEEVLTFLDPDGMQLELVAHAGASQRSPWQDGPIPADQAIRGFHSVTLWEEGFETTAELLTGILGLRLLQEEGARFRFRAEGGEMGTLLDLFSRPDGQMGRGGAGTIHHIAWRARDDEEEEAWRQTIASHHFNVTPILDRQYFHSIYFREPGGVLFEIATDPPGFTLDERVEELGTYLKLPRWLEPHRRDIEQILPEITHPTIVKA